MKMAEPRAHNVAEGMMVAERLAVLTDRRLAQYHREGDALSGLTGVASTAASAVIGELGLQLGIERTDQPVKAVAHPGGCVTEIAALLVM